MNIFLDFRRLQGFLMFRNRIVLEKLSKFAREKEVTLNNRKENFWELVGQKLLILYRSKFHFYYNVSG